MTRLAYVLPVFYTGYFFTRLTFLYSLCSGLSAKICARCWADLQVNENQTLPWGAQLMRWARSSRRRSSLSLNIILWAVGNFTQGTKLRESENWLCVPQAAVNPCPL